MKYCFCDCKDTNYIYKFQIFGGNFSFLCIISREKSYLTYLLTLFASQSKPLELVFVDDVSQCLYPVGSGERTSDNFPVRRFANPLSDGNRSKKLC